MEYTYSERMSYEVGIQTAKTAIEFLDSLTREQKDAAKAMIEKRANTHPDMRVMEPARQNIKNLN